MRAFNISVGAAVYVFGNPVSMSCGFPKLTELAAQLDKPEKGALFLFVNKRGTYVKILWHQKGGYCIFSKKLHSGAKFDVHANDGRISINALMKVVDEVIVHGVKRKAHLKKAA